MPTIADLFNEALRIHKSGDLPQAERIYRQIIQLDPTHAPTYHFFGILAHQAGNHQAAVSLLHEALRLNPNNPEAFNALGIAFAGEGQMSPAIDSFRQALRLNPHHAEIIGNLGNALVSQGQLAEATACFDKALRIDPKNGMTRFHRALLHLLQGDFAAGWPDYEWRWLQREQQPRAFAQARWNGAPLNEQTLLVHAEQGLGDTIQFVRYLPLLQKLGVGGRILFECQPELVELLRTVEGIDQVIPRDEPLPPFERHVPLLSLPGIFGTNAATIPADIPYLRADAERVHFWQDEIRRAAQHQQASVDTKLNIGIAWQGNPTFRGDKTRSIPFSLFERLASVPGVRLISLQKGQLGTEQRRALTKPFPILDLSDRLSTFSDTAAVMMNLDLVVSSCTAVPHLAGALGIPVWTVLQFVPDWRWQLERQDSPWYPTMRLFRQSKPGDWEGVFERIAAEVSGNV
jgi:tetratricopeptide (TPR) repeat protein